MRAMLKPCDEISTSARQQWQPPPLRTASWCSLQGTSAPSAPCQPRGPGSAPRAPAGALGGSSRSHLGAGIASESGGPQNIVRNTVVMSAHQVLMGFPQLGFFTCCALKLLSSCSSRVLSFISRLSLFSQVDCSCASALCSLSTFST